MGRISQYPLDEDIQGNDKWIGTSVINANATKNFSVDKVIEYINKTAGTDSQNLRYTYQNADNDLVRLSTTISFSTPLGDNVPFSGITEWIISAFSKPIKDVRTYYDAPLIDSTILITHATNPSNWAIFRWNSVTVDIDNPDFYTIGLTHIDSSGGLEVNEDYLLALLDYGSASGGASWGSITGTLSAQTDLQSALNAKQATLISGTNIQSINGSSILVSGDLSLQVPLVSGINIKTINSTTLLGSGDIAVQPILVSGTNIKTINGTTLLGSGDITITSGASWGSITGTLSAQTDLQNALNAKFDDPTGTSADYLDGTGAVQPFPTSFAATKMVTVGRNATGATLRRGTVVYLDGSTGNVPNFVKAQANSEATSAGTFGVIESDIANNTDGNCVTIGAISNLDTRNTAPFPFTNDVLSDGDTIYLSPTTAGYVTNIKPSAPNNMVVVGEVVRTSPTNGTIVYRIINGFELQELHNVSAQTPSDNDLIQYNSATTLWENKSLSGAGIQPTLISGTSIKTINSNSLLGSGDVAVQDTLISGTNIKTINGSSILGSGNLAIAAGASGVAGSVQFSDGTALSSDATNFFWDNTAKELGIGINTPGARLHIKGLGSTSATYSLYAQNNSNSDYMRYRDDGQLQIYNSGVGTTTILNGYDIVGYRIGRSGYGFVNFDGGFYLRDSANVIATEITSSEIIHTKPTIIGAYAFPVAQAVLELSSTTRGFLPPRMTTTQRDAIATPPDGLVLYNTTSKAFNYRINGAWEDFGSQTNARTTASAAINTTETILVSSPTLATNRLMASSIIRITFTGTNTSSVAGSHTFRVRIGTLGTTADGLMFTVNTANSAASGTNIAFSGEIIITIRTVGASSTAYGTLKLWNAGSTGISTVLTQVINGTMTNFDNTLANIISLSYLSAAATTTSTFQQAIIEITD